VYFLSAGPVGRAQGNVGDAGRGVNSRDGRRGRELESHGQRRRERLVGERGDAKVAQQLLGAALFAGLDHGALGRARAVPDGHSLGSHEGGRAHGAQSHGLRDAGDRGEGRGGTCSKGNHWPHFNKF